MKPIIERLADGPGRDNLKPVLEFVPNLNIFTGPWIAGGAARRIYEGQAIHGSDIDIFCGSQSQVTTLRAHLTQHGRLEHESKAALSFVVPKQDIDYKVQLIKRLTYRNPEEMVNDFDFTVCQIATDGDYLFYTAEAKDHIDNRILSFAQNGRVAPVNVPRRAFKYINYGFVPQPGIMPKVIKEGLRNVSFDDIENSNYAAETTPVATWISNASTY